MKSNEWHVIVAIVVGILVILVSLLFVRYDGGDDGDGGERSATVRGELTGNLTATGTIWSHETFSDHPIGITIYRGPSGEGELRAMVTDVSSVTVFSSKSDGRADGTYQLEDRSFTIVSDFERTYEATIVTWLEDYECSIKYKGFNGSMTEYDEYEVDIEYESFDATGRIVRGPSFTYDILAYDVTLILGNRTLHLERAELTFPKGTFPDVVISAHGVGDLDHMPDVMVRGTVMLSDFQESVGLGPISFDVEHVTYRGDLIRIRTIQEPDYFNEPHTPWIVEIKVTAST